MFFDKDSESRIEIGKNSFSWNEITDKPSTFAPSSHTHNSIQDAGSGTTTTFAYSKSEMDYGNYTWLAGWNGYELRAINKSQFATANHTHSYLPLSGGTMSGTLQFTDNIGLYGIMAGGTDWWGLCGTGTDDNGILKLTIGDNAGEDCDAFWIVFHDWSGTDVVSCKFTGRKIVAGVPLYGAVWNDYAEFRNQEELIEPGYCVYCDDNGKLKKTKDKLSRFEGIVSDTFGFSIGETDKCRTPLAVSGRVLVYVEGNREDYHNGDCLCASRGGLASKMSREEIIKYPDRIIGIVSEIPEYEEWGTGKVKVNNRIWVKVK